MSEATEVKPSIKPFLAVDDPYLPFAIAKTRGRLAMRASGGVIAIYRMQAARYLTGTDGVKRLDTPSRWVLIGRADEKMHHDDCGSAILAAVLQVTTCPLAGDRRMDHG